MSGRSRTGLIGAALASLFTWFAVFAVATPAQALPPGCVISQGYMVDGGSNVGGFSWWLGCDTGGDIPRPVTIQRYVSPVQWTTIATGTGDVWHPCGGHALNQYRVNGGTPFFYACGS
jgi:hypothetical protein